MKRLNSSDSLCALLSTQSPKEEKGRKKTQIYSREFPPMLDGLDQDEGGEAEVGEAAGDKKRRLSSDQVKALEKNFEVENKLEPERKAKLAKELGLLPRQVAIWFQNRRARYKTKQLERDYGLLKAEYDSLKLDFDSLEQENEALAAELTELKTKLHHENRDSSTKEESPASESMTDVVAINGINKEFDILGDAIKEDPTKYEDGKLLSSSSSASFQHNSSQLLNWIQFSNSRAVPGKPNLTQIVAADEQQSFGTTEESSNFLSVDHAPTLHWYIPQ